MYDSQKEAKSHTAIIIQSQQDCDLIPQGQPLHLEIIFFMRIPRKIRTRRQVEKNYTPHPLKPDISNLIKFVEDVASKILFHDDAQIASISARKIYHENPRTAFSLTILDKNEKYSQ